MTIMFFTGDRKPLHFEILAREWRSSNGISFYRLFTALYDFHCSAKFWNIFLSLILRERESINVPICNLTLNYCKKKTNKQTQRHSSKLTQPQNLEKERKLNCFFNRSEGLFCAPFYILSLVKMLFHSIFFSFICGGEISLSKISQFQYVAKFYHIEHKKKTWYFNRNIFFEI